MPYRYDSTDYDPNESGYELISVGEHRVVCEEASERTSSSGNQMMELVFKVLDGVGKGGLLWYYIVYNQWAAQNFGRMMESMGMDPTLDRQITPDLFMGKTGTVMVKHEHSDAYGTQAKIRYFVSNPTPPDLSPDGVVEDEDPEDTPYQ